MKKLFQIAGVKVLAFIEENIKKGIDYEGNAFQYSTNPYYIPFNDAIYKKLGGKNGNGKLFQMVYSKRTGLLGMIILGGYKAYKEKVHPSAAKSYLTVTGKMLRSMDVKATDNEAIISFTGEEEQQKAFWFNVSGVGRSRKLWKFLGITEMQKKQLTEELTESAREIVVAKLGEIIKKNSD